MEHFLSARHQDYITWLYFTNTFFCLHNTGGIKEDLHSLLCDIYKPRAYQLHSQENHKTKNTQHLKYKTGSIQTKIQFCCGVCLCVCKRERKNNWKNCEILCMSISHATYLIMRVRVKDSGELHCTPTPEVLKTWGHTPRRKPWVQPSRGKREDLVEDSVEGPQPKGRSARQPEAAGSQPRQRPAFPASAEDGNPSARTSWRSRLDERSKPPHTTTSREQASQRQNFHPGCHWSASSSQQWTWDAGRLAPDQQPTSPPKNRVQETGV